MEEVYVAAADGLKLAAATLSRASDCTPSSCSPSEEAAAHAAHQMLSLRPL